MRCPRTIALAAATAAAVLTGCTATPEEPFGGSAEPEERVPNVAFTAEPRDLERLEMCELIGAETARELGLTAKGALIANRASDSGLGDECYWDGAPESGTVSLSLVRHLRLTFREILLQHSADASEVAAVDGYPVFNATGESSLDCELYIGLSEGTAVRIEALVETETAGAACDIARSAAEEIVATVPAAA